MASSSSKSVPVEKTPVAVPAPDKAVAEGEGGGGPADSSTSPKDEEPQQNETFTNVLQIKIALKYLKPPIWRRIEVPDTFNFRDLHYAIQDAMHGWMGYHLHQFKFGRDTTIVMREEDVEDEPGIFLPGFGVFGRSESILETDALVKDYLGPLAKTCIYEYDFGDSWDHKVTLEKIIPRQANVEYPRITAGRRACPPEDSGSFGGYMENLEILKKPNHRQFASVRKWMLEQSHIQRDDNDEFDPAYFNKNSVKFRTREEQFEY